MSSIHRNGRSARAKVNRCGWRCSCRGAIEETGAQLSVGVLSPTLRIAVVKDDAGVLISSSHRNGRSTSTEVNRSG